MPTWIALLRAVNVGGSAAIAMADLRALASDLGFGDPRTVLHSGNLVFSSDETDAASLEALIERGIADRLGLPSDILARSLGEWTRLIAGNPFAEQAARDPSHLVIMALKAEPAAADIDALRASIKGRERISAAGRHLYAVYPDGIGRSKLTAKVIEAALRTRGTARNWNTVLKLAAQATLAAKSP